MCFSLLFKLIVTSWSCLITPSVFCYLFVLLQPFRWCCVDCVITTNGMCTKNKNICVWREQAMIEWSWWSDLGEWPLIMLVNLVNSWLCLLTVTTRVISSGDLCCCLLPRCEALRICRSGFPITTVLTLNAYLQYGTVNVSSICFSRNLYLCFVIITALRTSTRFYF